MVWATNFVEVKVAETEVVTDELLGSDLPNTVTCTAYTKNISNDASTELEINCLPTVLTVSTYAAL